MSTLVDAILAEATARGLEVRADGDCLRVRPRDALPPDLAATLRRYRTAVIAVLRERTYGARGIAAQLIRAARANGAKDDARTHRAAWRERIAVCTVDGGCTRERAEALATEQIRREAST